MRQVNIISISFVIVVLLSFATKAEITQYPAHGIIQVKQYSLFTASEDEKLVVDEYCQKRERGSIPCMVDRSVAQQTQVIPTVYDIRAIPDLPVRRGETVELKLQIPVNDERYTAGLFSNRLSVTTTGGSGTPLFEQNADGSAILKYQVGENDLDPIRFDFHVDANNAYFPEHGFGYFPLVESFYLMPEPPDEADIIDRHPLARPNEDNYISVVRETVSGRNNVIITGKTIRINNGWVNNDRFDLGAISNNIGQLILKADRIFIEDNLTLPGAQVELSARELYFTTGLLGFGSFLTGPRIDVSGQARTGTGNPDGSRGRDAGRISIHAGSVVPDAAMDDIYRFILDGGRGQNPRQGNHGQAGTSVTSYGCDGGCGFGWDPIKHNWKVYYYENWAWTCRRDCPFCSWYIRNQRITSSGGDPNRPPTSGEDATESGRPGAGGDGGTFQSTIRLSHSSANVRAGFPGSPGRATSGGRAGTPSPGYDLRLKPVCPTSNARYEEYNVARPQDGKSYPQEKTSNPGSEGAVEITESPYAWLDPAIVRAVLTYARDLYIARHVTETEKVLTSYITILEDFETSSDWLTVPEDQRLEFVQLLNRMRQLAARAGSGLDYFGRPAGWVPALSFELQYSIFEQEIDRSIRLLSLANFVNRTIEANELIALGLEEQIRLLEDAIRALEQDYARKSNQFTEAFRDIGNVSVEIEALQGSLQSREAMLIERAQREIADAERRNRRIARIRGVARLTGTLLTVLPVPGQPAWAAVGTGLQILSEFDPDKPWDTIERLPEIGKAYKSEEFANLPDQWQNAIEGVKNANLKDPKAVVDALKELQPLITPVKEDVERLLALSKGTAVTDKEVAAKLAELKAQMPDFEEGINQAGELLKRKQQLHEQVVILTMEINEIMATIESNLLAIHALRSALADTSLNNLSRFKSFAQDLEQTTKERLLEYYYYLVKAYEYRFLQPYSTNLQLIPLYEELEKQFNQWPNQIGHKHWNQIPFDLLKAVFESELANISQSIFRWYIDNRPPTPVTVNYRLSEDERRRLATDGSIEINPITKGLVSLQRENLRIVDLTVLSVDATSTASQGSIPPSIEIVVAHPGQSRITKAGQVYKFINHQQGVSPFFWGADYDLSSNTLAQKPPSQAVNSLFAVLLGINPHETLIYSQPPLWTDLTLEWAWNTGVHAGQAVEFNDVMLQFVYEYENIPASTRYLHVAADDVAPYIAVNRADRNSRQGNYAEFVRAYNSGTTVELTAPQIYGEREFQEWRDINGATLSSQPTLNLSMNQHRAVQPVYQVNPVDSEVCPFDENLVLQSQTVNHAASFHACKTITAGPAFTVSPTGNVTLQAGQRITLRPGFRVQHGGKFIARIGADSLTSLVTAAVESDLSLTEGIPHSDDAILNNPDMEWTAQLGILTWSELPAALRALLAARDAVIRDAQQSADGSVIVFATDTALVAEDDNDHSDIYHYAVDADILTVISKNPAGYAADGPSHSPRLSGNSQQVVYISIATDLVAGVSNEYAQLYHHDPVFGTTTRLTETTGGQPGAGDSGQVILAEDWVIYRTEAANLDPSGPGIYRQHLHDGQRQAVGLDDWGVPDPQASHPAADDHGEQIAYQRPDGMDRQQIYLNDLLLVERLSLHGDPAFGLLDHCCAALSTDGRFLAYREQGTQGPAWLHVLDRDTDRFVRLPWPEDDEVQYRPPQFRHDATELWWPALEQGPNLPEVLHRVSNPLVD